MYKIRIGHHRSRNLFFNNIYNLYSKENIKI